MRIRGVTGEGAVLLLQGPCVFEGKGTTGKQAQTKELQAGGAKVLKCILDFSEHLFREQAIHHPLTKRVVGTPELPQRSRGYISYSCSVGT